MKTMLLLICLFFLSVESHSQELIVRSFKTQFVPAEIIMTDGSVAKGFINDFTLPKSIEFRGFGYEFKSMESKLHLDDRTFNFRSNMNGETTEMNLDDILTIVIIDEYGGQTTYEKLKLKTINTKNEVIDLKREVMMPLISEGDINLYGINVSSCQTNCETMFTIAYIKHQDQDYAYIPIDMNRINLFNLGPIDDKLLKSFEEVGRDCEEFLDYLETTRKNFNDKEFRKNMKEEYKAFQKEKKEKLKDVKGAKNRRLEEDKLDTAYFLSLYTNIIDEYDARCGE